MMTPDEPRREELKKALADIEKAIRQIKDDLNYIRYKGIESGVFQVCETIDIVVSEHDIECSAWNDYTGGYLFDFTIKEVRK